MDRKQKYGPKKHYNEKNIMLRFFFIIIVSFNSNDFSEDIKKNIVLSGWLHRKRDHGNLLFLDLRDHYGVTQCVIENNSQYFNLLEKTKILCLILLT